MSFRQIGIPARKVIDRIKAARGHDGAHEFADGSPNEGVTSEPSGRSDEGTTRATESPERVEAPGVAATREVAKSRGELKLVSINCEPARFAANHVPPQARRVGSHLVLVSGGHARTVPW